MQVQKEACSGVMQCLLWDVKLELSAGKNHIPIAVSALLKTFSRGKGEAGH